MFRPCLWRLVGWRLVGVNLITPRRPGAKRSCDKQAENCHRKRVRTSGHLRLALGSTLLVTAQKAKMFPISAFSLPPTQSMVNNKGAGILAHHLRSCHPM